MNKVAIVLGATGLVGRALVDQLAKAEQIGRVITITRKPTEHPSLKVSNQVVDFNNLRNYASLFNGDFLFSCLGTTVREAGSIAAQRRVDLDYQFEVAQLASKNGIHHYLLVSSASANDQSNNPYLKMKGELEQKIISLPFKRISIFQPSLLLGKRSDFRLGEKIGGWGMRALCKMPMLQRFRPIRGEEVAAKMVLVSQQSGPILERFRFDEVFP